MNGVKTYDTRDTAVASADFMQMLANGVKNQDAYVFTTSTDSNVITRYKVMELVSSYLTETYNQDEILQGRQKYMNVPEMYKIAETQNIDLEHVLDYTVVYSCGIFGNKSANGNANLTFAEAATIVVRVMAYEEMQARNDFNELMTFYTAHCTCALSGEHD